MEGEEGVEGWEAVDNEPTGRWGREGRKENEDRFLTPSFFPLVPSNTKKRGKRGVGAKILASDRRYSGSRLASANKVQLGYKDGRRRERQRTHSGRCGQPS